MRSVHPLKVKRPARSVEIPAGPTFEHGTRGLVMPSSTSEAASPALALASHGDHVIFAANTKAAEAMILKRGVAAIVKEAIEIVKFFEPSAAFGELSLVPDELPLFGDTVRADEAPVSLIYLATILVTDLDHARIVDQTGDRARGQLSRITGGKTMDKSQEQLAESSGNLIYAGYPYDPYK